MNHLGLKSLALPLGLLVVLMGASMPANAIACLGPVCSSTPAVFQDDVASNKITDVYSFAGDAGTAYTIRGDTVSAATAFDPHLRVCRDVDVDTARRTVMLIGCFAFADDTFACSFPPPRYSCPQASGTLPADDDGIYFVGIAAHTANNGSFAGPLGEYRLSINVVSLAPAAALLLDDRPGNLP